MNNKEQRAFLDKIFKQMLDGIGDTEFYCHNKAGDEKCEMGIDLTYDILKEVWQEQKEHISYDKFLFIEDGSVDFDELKKELEKTNPEIKVIVYRQGSNMPQLVDIKGKIE